MVLSVPKSPLGAMFISQGKSAPSTAFIHAALWAERKAVLIVVLTSFHKEFILLKESNQPPEIPRVLGKVEKGKAGFIQR